MKWLLAAVAVITLIVVGSYATPEAAVALVFGWASFMARVLPQVRVYWPTIIMGVTAFALFTVGLHWFLVQFRMPASSKDEYASPRWKFRWTAAAAAMVVVAFAAGISLVGVVHQVGWLANAKEPLLSETLAPTFAGEVRGNMRMIAMATNNAATVTDRYPASAKLSAEGVELHGWEFEILPFMTVNRSEIDVGRPWNDPANQRYFKCIIPDFINTELRGAPLTDESGYGLNHFAANSRVFKRDATPLVSDVEKGASNTIMLGEVNAGFSPWGRPGNVRDPAAGISRGPGTFGGPPGRGGAYFAMADGTVV